MSVSREAAVLEHIAKQLVDDPAAVVVTERNASDVQRNESDVQRNASDVQRNASDVQRSESDVRKLHLAVGEADVGKVIGRGGRMAKAIRALLKVVATRDGSRVDLEID